MNNILYALHLNETIIKLMIAALILAGAAVIFSLLRCPPWYTARAARAFRKSGLCVNGEYPILRHVKRDKEKPHGIIFCVRNNCVTIPDMEHAVESLKLGLGGLVYNMRYANKARDTLICVLPWKYVHPSVLSPDDDAIASESIRNLINLLVVGATGTGKTVALKIIMKKIVDSQHNARLWLLDFKKFDFANFNGLPRYYGYMDCIQGLNDYYDAFKRQQALGVAAEPNYLVIDEWGSFLTSLEKRQAEQLKARLSELLSTGRSYQYIPIIGLQRGDSSYFAAARDNFQCRLALGNLSPEGRKMVIPDSAAEQITECRKREGHLYIDGIGLEKIKIAEIPDMDALDASIREAMLRQLPAGADGDAQQAASAPPPIGGD